MLSKINKKVKTTQLKPGMMCKLIPVYLIGFTVLSYLGYRVEWLLLAISKLVGQRLPTENQPLVEVPSPYNMVFLYMCLKRFQDYQPEAWLKSV
jgi:hypothetical protein